FVFASTGLAQPEALMQSIARRGDSSWEMALKIWDYAEPGYQEKRSAALLADTLAKAGFKVERGVAKIPTAFVATIGWGQPVIGIMGEYDALPGPSQDAVANLKKLNDLKYDDEEKKFAIRIQETLADRPPLESIAEVEQGAGSLSKGSTDVSHVSWMVPVGGFTTACWVPGTP